MSTITATDDYVYTLEYGQILRQKTGNLEQKSIYSVPDGVVVQIMATDGHLYALRDDGTAARRSHNDTAWVEYVVPANTTHLSSSDHDIYALAEHVYKRHDEDDQVFTQIVEMNLPNMVQLDHDEAYSYALTSGGDIYVAPTYQAWSLYPVPLNNVAQVIAGLTYLYARSNTGEVYRSHHVAYSGWTRLDESSNVVDMAIETTHRDRLWYVRSGVQFQNPPDWVAGPRPQYWVVADWADPEWVITEPEG